MAAPNPRALKTAKLLIAAIDEIRDGASKEDITQHLATEFAVPNKDISKYLNKAINKGIAFGAIKKLRGRYHLGDVMECVRMHRRRRRKSRSRSRRRRRRRSHH
ncbi:linker histone H1 and H5 family [Popillia japonica]|uniref:Linker histone H1 and H5 family n=1 Tax=Popillia japonica TaxID=7064 RepID=A0AAW1IEA3_POPJA